MRALVLAGGGALGAFEIGVLRQWVNKDPSLDYDLFCGTSAGAINSAALASFAARSSFHDAVIQVENIWRDELCRQTIFDYFPYALSALWQGALCDTTPLKKLLKKHVGGHPSKNVFVCATNVVRGTSTYVSHDDPEFLEAVRASAAVPIVFPPVTLRGEPHYDGALTHNLPLGEAIRRGATEIDVIMCTNPWTTKTWKPTKNILKRFSRVVEIMANGMGTRDVELTGIKNDIADLSGEYKNVKVTITTFDRSDDFGMLDFSKKNVRTLLDIGLHASFKRLAI